MSDKAFRQAFKAYDEKEKTPDQLVAATLLKMQEELAKVEEEKQRKTPFEKLRRTFADRKPQRRWALGAALACAAALCLLLPAGQPELNLSPFTYQADLRLSGALRGENAAALLPHKQARLEEIMGASKEMNRTGYDFIDFSFDEAAPVLWAAVSQYDTPARMEVTASNFKTSLVDALGSGAPNEMQGMRVYAGRDEATGDVFAAWQEDEQLFVQVRIMGGAALKPQEQRRCIEAVLSLQMGRQLTENGGDAP